MNINSKLDIPIDLSSFFELGRAPTRPHIKFIRQGLEGNVIGYEEVCIQARSK